MTDIAPIQGLIELKDDFTSQLGVAEAALSQFSASNQESLKSTAIAAGLVVTAFTAVAAATLELGRRGAEINDVNDTLEHFSGSAQNAEDNMEALRKGTKGLVDDFELAKDAAHLLSAGVKLTADDFGILGQAAFVLQNRGLGGTKEQLDLVSDAMVTGRTRALSMALGVIDAGDAEQNYADKLGIAKDQLSDIGKAEAKRIEVMRILNEAVKDAGVQERDFGEELQYGKTQLVNMVDELASSVASSQVFAAGFKAIETAISSAFNGDKKEAIQGVVKFLEQGAIKTLDFAHVAIDMAKVVDGAWNAVKTVILGVETVITAAADNVTLAVEGVAIVAEKLHLVSPETVAGLKETEQYLKAMTDDLADQTKEAAKGIFGATSFSKTLDALDESLTSVQHAMSSATDEQKKNSDAMNIAAKNAKMLSDTEKQLSIDHEKVATALQKSSTELAAIWNDYYKLVAKYSGTSRDQQIADIEATASAAIDKLDASDKLYQAKYDAIRAIADETTKHIGDDWDSVKDKSIDSLNEQAAAALETYNHMMTSGLTFRREVLDAQLEKYHQLRDQARGWGDDQKKAVTEAADAVKLLDHAWVTDADIAAATLNKTTIMVRTLSGELISLAEQEKRQRAGGSFDVTSQNFEKSLQDIITTGGWNPSGIGSNIDIQQAYKWAKQGYSFSEIIQIFNLMKAGAGGPIPPPQGPRIPGFREGGTIMVGESGPEVVRLPLGSTVYPGGSSSSSDGDTNITNHFYVNGTGEQVADQIFGRLMQKLKTVRKFPTAT
jgi:hypothetical protein